MKSKISETFIKEIFCFEIGECKLKEIDQNQYEIKVRWAKDKEMIVIKPGEIKRHSTYINERFFPKDCDFVLIDIEDKNIFFIELKQSSGTSTAAKVAEQLKGGEAWIEHLFFIMGIKDEFEDFSKFYIHSACKSRARIKRNYLENKKNGVYKINGPLLNLLPFINGQY